MNSLPIAVKDESKVITTHAPTISKNVAQGSFITWLLSRRGISMRKIADHYDCHFDMVSKVIWGKRNSKELQDFIAKMLNYKSWDDLKKAEQVFNNSNNQFLRKLGA